MSESDECQETAEEDVGADSEKKHEDRTSSQTPQPHEDDELSRDELLTQIEELRSTRDELTEQVEALGEERDELKSRLKRTAADFENFKKRQAQREKTRADSAKEELLERFLTVHDNLTRALQQDDSDIDSLREGVKLTLSEFDRILDAENVAPIEPDCGDDVDATRHEVMMKVDSDVPEGQISDIYQTGYERDDSVIRPAQVAVSSGPKDDENQNEE